MHASTRSRRSLRPSRMAAGGLRLSPSLSAGVFNLISCPSMAANMAAHAASVTDAKFGKLQ